MSISIQKQLDDLTKYDFNTSTKNHTLRVFFNRIEQILRDSDSEVIAQEDCEQLVDMWFSAIHKWTKNDILEISDLTFIFKSASSIYTKLKLINSNEAPNFANFFLAEKIHVFNLMDVEHRRDDDLSVDLSFAQALAMRTNREPLNELIKEAFNHASLKDKVNVSRTGLSKTMNIDDFFLIYCEERNLRLYPLIAPSKREAVRYILNHSMSNSTPEIIKSLNHFKLTDADGAVEILVFIKAIKHILGQETDPYGQTPWRLEDLNELESYAQSIYDKEYLSKNLATKDLPLGMLHKI